MAEQQADYSESSPGQSKKSTPGKVLLSCVAAIVLIAFTVEQYEIGGLADHLTSRVYWLFPVLVLLIFFGNLIEVAQLYALLKKSDNSTDYFSISYVHFFSGVTSIVFPHHLASGGVSYLLLLKAGIGKFSGVLSLIGRRLFAGFVGLALGLGAFLLNASIQDKPLWGPVLLCLVISSTVLLLAIYFPMALAAMLTRICSRDNSSSRLAKLIEYLESSADLFARSRNEQIMLSVAATLIYASSLFLAFFMFGVEISLSAGVWFWAVLNLVLLLPITLLGIGAREITLVGLSESFFGVDPSKAFCASLTIFFAFIVVQFVGLIVSSYFRKRDVAT